MRIGNLLALTTLLVSVGCSTSSNKYESQESQLSPKKNVEQTSKSIIMTSDELMVVEATEFLEAIQNDDLDSAYALFSPRGAKATAKDQFSQQVERETLAKGIPTKCAHKGFGYGTLQMDREPFKTASSIFVCDFVMRDHSTERGLAMVIVDLNAFGQSNGVLKFTYVV